MGSFLIDLNAVDDINCEVDEGWAQLKKEASNCA